MYYYNSPFILNLAMRISFVVLLSLCYTISFAQYTYQNANSIVVNPNYKKNNASLETSFEFNHLQLTGIYNVSNQLFFHANLKLNVLQQKADKFFGGVLGSNPVMLHNNDIGFGFGFGWQLKNLPRNYHMQIALGYDYEKQRYSFNERLLNANDSYIDTVSNQNNALYKVSANFNLIKNNEKYNLAYLMRLSYCRFTKYEYNNTPANMQGSGFAIAQPAVEIDFKLLKSRNLAVVTQCGLSLPLTNFVYSYKTNLPSGEVSTETTDYLLDVILKLGVKYNFCHNVNH